MNFIKKNYKYLIIFIAFLFLYVCFFYENCSFDVIWNYGFAHAIRMGEVPYLDFNVISTPLYSFFMSLFLFIKDDMFMFMGAQALLVTILFYMLFRMYNSKAYLLLPVLAFPLFLQYNATYNFGAYFLIVLLFLLEKNKKSDYLIGFVLGLLILTKQTIGIGVFLLSLIALRDLKRIFKRFILALLPNVIFLIYLLVTKSLKPFLDLCFLGLIDFGSKNHTELSFLFFFSCFLALFLVYSIFKDRENILKYYALGSFLFTIPLFDFYHTGLFVGVFVLLYLDKITLSNTFIRNLSLVIFLIICLFNLILIPDKYDNFTFLGEKHFTLYGIRKKDKVNILPVIDKYKKCSNCYMLDELAMFYDLTTDKEISYFDVLLKGNYGYKGTSKMKKKIEKMHDVYFFIDKDKYKNMPSTNQLDVEVIKYAIKNSIKKDEILNYNIYYKE